jgi:hypothetical protein
MWFLKFIWTAIRNPGWFRDVWKAGRGVTVGGHNFESFENELKLAARRHNVDYHRFSE